MKAPATGAAARLIGGRDHKRFLNSRNELCRERKMKENPHFVLKGPDEFFFGQYHVSRNLVVKVYLIILGHNWRESSQNGQISAPSVLCSRRL